MSRIKITLSAGDVKDVCCSLLFVKHIEGNLSMPERALSQMLRDDDSNVFLEKEDEQTRNIYTYNCLPYPSIHVINFRKTELPFTYSSVDAYARKIVQFVLNNSSEQAPITSVATAVHGPGAGLDSSEAMEKMIVAFAQELQGKGADHPLAEIIFVEKDKLVFERLRERIAFLIRKNILVYDQSHAYLPVDEKAYPSQFKAYNNVELKAKHVFVAMPFDRNFDDVYLFGIKQAIEKNGRVSERVDQEFFSGDIIERMMLRIKDAELIVADISGNNPNVFYEIGLADGMGLTHSKTENKTKKKIVFITQQDSVPFDIQTQNRIKYDRLNISELYEKLQKAIGNVLDAAE